MIKETIVPDPDHARHSPALVDASTVMIVDGDEEVRKSLQSLVMSVGLMAATFTSAEYFLSQYDPDTPGCIVLDIRMPGSTGLHLLGEPATEKEYQSGDHPDRVRRRSLGGSVVQSGRVRFHRKSV